MVNPFLKEHNPTTLLPDPPCRETESCGASLYLNQHTLARKIRRWKPYTLHRELKTLVYKLEPPTQNVLTEFWVC